MLTCKASRTVVNRNAKIQITYQPPKVVLIYQRDAILTPPERKKVK